MDSIKQMVTLAKKWIHIGKGVDKQDVETKIDRFVHLCQHGKTKEEFFELVDIYDELFKLYIMGLKTIYNQLIGWALPSKQVCEVVFAAYQEHVKMYPNARIIDLGAGTGIFSYMFNQMGIPAANIIALDLENRTHSNKAQRSFWQITINDNFEFRETDILFVAWGSGIGGEVDRYCNSNGKCVILLGETSDGCTFPSDYFVKYDEDDEEQEQDQNEWKTESYHVPGPASAYSEHITVNIRKK